MIIIIIPLILIFCYLYYFNHHYNYYNFYHHFLVLQLISFVILFTLSLLLYWDSYVYLCYCLYHFYPDVIIINITIISLSLLFYLLNFIKPVIIYLFFLKKMTFQLSIVFLFKSLKKSRVACSYLACVMCKRATIKRCIYKLVELISTLIRRTTCKWFQCY